MLIVHSVMIRGWRMLERIPRNIRSLVMSACGLVALVTPLLMWASMSFGLFTLLITVWCLALFILGLMVMTSPDDHF